MNDYITVDDLIQFGINLSGEDVESLIAHLNETVEERIGAEITQSLTDDQLTELITLQESASDEELGVWIADHVPNHQAIVQETIDIVIGELAHGTDDVTKATQQ